MASPAQALSVQTGRVIHITDGDTFTVALPDGRQIRIRNTGINAMETGQCHAQEAEDRLRALVFGKTVTLKARSLSSMSGERYWRWVYVGNTDVQKVLLNEGLVVPFPHPFEKYKNKEYLDSGRRAAAKKIGIWDKDACASGPDQDNLLKLVVQWNANGDDKDNINGEYVRIHNLGTDRLELDGWWLRDAVDHYYYFKAGASIGAKSRLTVAMGKGTDTSTRVHAGFSYPPFGNVPPDRSYGDGAYLLDPDGDIRAFMTYPCTSCWTAMKGKISMSVRYAGSDPHDEWVKITNISSAPIDLAGFVLEVKPYIYDFDRSARVSSVLNPREYMRVRMGRGDDTRRNRYMDRRRGILDSSDAVRVRTFDLRIAGCRAWGSSSC